MKFRMRKRRRASTTQASTVQRPPQVITVNAADNPYDEDRIERKWALQKLFASHLLKISRKHLGDSRQNIRRRSSLADASTAGDTTVLRPDDKFPYDEPVQARPMPSFRITCGTNNSVVASATKGAHVIGRGHDTPCLGPEKPLALRCSDRPVEDTSKPFPSLLPPCAFWCPLLSFVPDSYSNDLKALDADKDGLLDTNPEGPSGCLYLLNHVFKRRPETKRNGIPKVITVVLENPDTVRRQSSCCGALSPLDKDESRRQQDPMRSFDTSLFRLEESLMRANLDADVEEKYETPMHEPRPDHDRGGTVTNTSVTSSISTHSSLKFGASIIKLPAAMTTNPATL